jgi:hypothetical protein
MPLPTIHISFTPNNNSFNFVWYQQQHVFQAFNWRTNQGLSAWNNVNIIGTFGFVVNGKAIVCHTPCYFSVLHMMLLAFKGMLHIWAPLCFTLPMTMTKLFFVDIIVFYNNFFSIFLLKKFIICHFVSLILFFIIVNESLIH